MLRLLALTMVLGAGCYSTRTTSTASLRPLAGGERDEALVVSTDERWRSRIAPNEVLTFVDGSGRRSERYPAGDLQVSEVGVYVSERLAIQRARAVRIAGLGEAERALLRASAPGGAEVIELGAGRVELRAPGPGLLAWLQDFTQEVAGSATDTPFYQKWALCRVGTTTVIRYPPRGATLPAGCTMGDPEDWAMAHLRHELGSAPLGGWSFHFGDGWWSERVLGEAIHLALADGVEMRVGWGWSEIDRAEVTDLSGVKSLAGLLGYTAVAATLGTKAANVLVQPRSPTERPLHIQPWQPDLTGSSAIEARPMFTGRARRRSVVQLVATAEAGGDPLGMRSVFSGVSLGGRFGELVEVGVGFRQALAWPQPGSVAHRSPAPTGQTSTQLYYFRLGGHFPLDAGHRFAIPLLLDLGGSDGGMHFRVNLGLRYRVSRSWFLGGYLLNPSYVQHDESSSAAMNPRWTFSSGLELGFTY